MCLADSLETVHLMLTSQCIQVVTSQCTQVVTSQCTQVVTSQCTQVVISQCTQVVTSLHAGNDITMHTGGDIIVYTGSYITVHTGSDITVHTGSFKFLCSAVVISSTEKERTYWFEEPKIRQFTLVLEIPVPCMRHSLLTENVLCKQLYMPFQELISFFRYGLVLWWRPSCSISEVTNYYCCYHLLKTYNQHSSRLKLVNCSEYLVVFCAIRALYPLGYAEPLHASQSVQICLQNVKEPGATIDWDLIF